MNKVITRFPPSPTGDLHIGSVRTAIFNWLLARSTGGTFILRLEDTDKKRSKEEYTKVIFESLEWLGLDFDEGPYYQSQRVDIHLEYVNKLIEKGRAYYCVCTPEELTARREEAMRTGGKPKYDGKCRNLNLGPAPGAVLRFRGPEEGSTSWNDLVKGPISYENSELDDLILLKGDGLPTYHMAVVVDDLTMGVTHVIRGDDHINNTPRQLLIYHALDAAPPLFGHMPLTLGADKSKLSKRHGAVSTLAYREMGYLPEAMLNYLVRLGWSHGDEEIFSREDLIEKFSVENIGKSPGVFDIEKLNWLNAHYIKEADPGKLAELLEPFLSELGFSMPDDDYLKEAIITLQPRSKTLKEMAEGMDFYLLDEIEFEPKAAKKFLKPGLVSLMADLIVRIKGMEDFSEKDLEDLFTAFMEAHEVKLGKIAQPVRVGLTGRSASPGLFEIMVILGKDRIVKRLNKALAFMEERAANQPG